MCFPGETMLAFKRKKEDKCQESIQLVPHLTQNTLWESDKRTRKRHTVLSTLRSAQTRAVAVYFKVARRSIPSTAEGTKGWRARMGNHSTLSLGGLTRYFVLILSVSMAEILSF